MKRFTENPILKYAAIGVVAFVAIMLVLALTSCTPTMVPATHLTMEDWETALEGSVLTITERYEQTGILKLASMIGARRGTGYSTGEVGFGVYEYKDASAAKVSQPLMDQFNSVTNGNLKLYHTRGSLNDFQAVRELFEGF